MRVGSVFILSHNSNSAQRVREREILIFIQQVYIERLFNMHGSRENIKISANKVLHSGAYGLVYIAILYERSGEGPKNVYDTFLLSL